MPMKRKELWEWMRGAQENRELVNIHVPPYVPIDERLEKEKRERKRVSISPGAPKEYKAAPPGAPKEYKAAPPGAHAAVALATPQKKRERILSEASEDDDDESRHGSLSRSYQPDADPDESNPMFLAIYTLSFLMLGLIVSGYIAAGAFYFKPIEEKSEKQKFENLEKTKSTLFTKMRNTADTAKFNKSYWNLHASAELAEYEESLESFYRKKQTSMTNKSQQENSWTIYGSTVFTASAVTSIGWGNVVPKTQIGRLSFVVYVMFGIPLLFSFNSLLSGLLNQVAEMMWQTVKAVFKRKKGHAYEEMEPEEDDYLPAKNQTRNRLTTSLSAIDDGLPLNNPGRPPDVGRHEKGDGQWTNGNKSKSNRDYYYELKAFVDYVIDNVDKEASLRHPKPDYVISEEDVVPLSYFLASLSQRDLCTCMSCLGLDLEVSTCKPGGPWDKSNPCDVIAVADDDSLSNVSSHTVVCLNNASLGTGVAYPPLSLARCSGDGRKAHSGMTSTLAKCSGDGRKAHYGMTSTLAKCSGDGRKAHYGMTSTLARCSGDGRKAHSGMTSTLAKCNGDGRKAHSGMTSTLAKCSGDGRKAHSGMTKSVHTWQTPSATIYRLHRNKEKSLKSICNSPHLSNDASQSTLTTRPDSYWHSSSTVASETPMNQETQYPRNARPTYADTSCNHWQSSQINAAQQMSAHVCENGIVARSSLGSSFRTKSRYRRIAFQQEVYGNDCPESKSLHNSTGRDMPANNERRSHYASSRLASRDVGRFFSSEEERQSPIDGNDRLPDGFEPSFFVSKEADVATENSGLNPASIRESYCWWRQTTHESIEGQTHAAFQQGVDADGFHGIDPCSKASHQFKAVYEHNIQIHESRSASRGSDTYFDRPHTCFAPERSRTDVHTVGAAIRSQYARIDTIYASATEPNPCSMFWPHWADPSMIDVEQRCQGDQLDRNDNRGSVGSSGSSEEDGKGAMGEDGEVDTHVPFLVYLVVVLVDLVIGMIIFLPLTDDKRYSSSLYFTVVMVTTIGFGDILPTPEYYLSLVIYGAFGMALVNFITNKVIENILDLINLINSYGKPREAR